MIKGSVYSLKDFLQFYSCGFHFEKFGLLVYCYYVISNGSLNYNKTYPNNIAENPFKSKMSP